LNKPVIKDESHLFFGVFKVQESAALKGCETVIVSGDTAYFWPDVFNVNEVKVIRLPELEPSNEILKIDYEPIDTITIRATDRFMGFKR
jgi:hypothetical protein